jgi:carbamoyltransferase
VAETNHARLLIARPRRIRERLFGKSRGVGVILGIACTGHGASLAALTRDGAIRSSVLDRWAGVRHTLLFAEAEERDIKNAKSDIDKSIHYCLSYGYGKFPYCRVFERTIHDWLEWFLDGLNLRARDIDLVVTSEGHFAMCALRLGGQLHRWFPRAAVSRWIEHHEIHQRQAFWQSGFEEAAVLTLDSSGEPLKRLDGRKIAGTIARMNARGECAVLTEMLTPESSPGLLYEIVTRHVGFRLGDEGKTMGLAPYGSPELLERLLPSLELRDDGSFRFLDPENLRALLREYIPERWPHEEFDARHLQVAYAGQAILERIVTNAFRAAMELTGAKRLAYSGGVALNSVANEIAARATRPEALYIAPNPGDTGHALGCALYGAYEIAGWIPPRQETPEYLGPTYTADAIERALRGVNCATARPESPETALARCIANGHITARFDGAAEYGPRALGNRSILCDPRRGDMKDYLNARVKHREGFRPFAPAVLEEAAADWFDLDGRSAYMLRVVAAREEMKSRIPAVVHVDGSCRVQTVASRENPAFYRLIREFASLTSVPVILNTSFNIAGKPIVETPRDAVECFLSTEIDVLAMGPALLSKRPLGEYLERPRA